MNEWSFDINFEGTFKVHKTFGDLQARNLKLKVELPNNSEIS